MQKISLRAYRVNAGLTIKEVADKIKVSEASIRRWEKDKDRLRGASIDDILKLCDLYGITLNDIDI